MTEQKKTLKEETAELSKKVAASLVKDDKAGVIQGSVDVYNDNLPEGFTPETVKQLSEYNTLYVSAGAHAVGEAAVEILASNKDLDKITGNLPMGHKDSSNFTVYREKEYPKPARDGQPPGKVVKKGSMLVSFDVRATNNIGQLAIAKGLILEAASEKL